ncbi:MAG: transporter, family, 3-phenylpropionic acid transporter [Methylobacteriaceae bacterium]|nr:transporter, family, 3-phenylpropionic acid transporter [Methylobacteriaceae bacterium]
MTAAQRAAAAPASGLRLSFLTASVYATIGIHLPFFPIWLAARGLSAREISAIASVPPLMRLVANLVLPPRADRSGDIPGMLTLCALGTTCAYASMGIIDGFWLILAAVAALAFAQGPVIPLADALILNEVRRRARAGLAALDYARVRGWGSASVLFMMVAGGQIVGLLPREAIIWLLAGTALVTTIVARQCAQQLPRNETGVLAAATLPGRIPRPAAIALFALAAASIQASHAFLYVFASLQWRSEGVSDGFIGLLWAAGVATETLFFLFLGPRLGESHAFALLMTGGLVAIFRWLCMAAEPGAVALLALQMLHGATYGATQLGAVYLLSRLAGPERRAQAQGWLSAAGALLLAAASFWSGYLQVEFGRVAYLFMVGIAVAGLALAGLAAFALHNDAASSGP